MAPKLNTFRILVSDLDSGSPIETKRDTSILLIYQSTNPMDKIKSHSDRALIIFGRTACTIQQVPIGSLPLVCQPASRLPESPPVQIRSILNPQMVAPSTPASQPDRRRRHGFLPPPISTSNPADVPVPAHPPPPSPLSTIHRPPLHVRSPSDRGRRSSPASRFFLLFIPLSPCA